jgi:hypothetical protein
MATRLNPKHDEATRQKIQTSQLVNRLQEFIFGEAQMEKSQVTAALGLLKKTLPDLSATTLDANVGLRHEDALAELE